MKKVKWHKALKIVVVLVLVTMLAGTWPLGQTSTVYAAPSVASFYFYSKSTENWTDSPYIIDKILTNYAYTSTTGKTEKLDENECQGHNLGKITTVELGVYAYGDGNDHIDLTPYFEGTSKGSTYQTTPGTKRAIAWHYVDITNDTAKPDSGDWTWSDIPNINVDVTYIEVKAAKQMNCAAVVIRVAYIQVFTITASADTGGTISPSGAVSVNETDSKSFTISPDVNYHIDDVVVDGDSKGAVPSYTFTNVTDDHTIHASFAIDTYTITASADTGGNISPSGAVSVNATKSQSFTITPDTHYHIDDVVVDGDSKGTVPYYDFNNVTDNHTIDAYFAIDTYTITASADTGGNISPSGAVSVNATKSQSFTITPDVNYHIVDVLVDVSSVGAVGSHTFTNVTADHTIEAFFAINTYTITATAGNGGNISPSGTVSVNATDSKTFTISPDVNYHIANVIVDDSSVGTDDSYTFDNVTDNHTIDAYFAIDTYTITASADTGGTISPSGAVSVNYGTDKTFTITPDTGYHIADVVVDGDSKGAVPSYTFTNVTDDHTIHAYFAIDTYTITATAKAGGTISPSGAVSVNATKSQSFTITPDIHYHIDDVIVDDSSVGDVPSYTFDNVTDNHTIDASFAIDTHDLRIEVEVSGSGGTTIPPPDKDHAYPYGTEVNISAIPDARWKFVKWTGDVANPSSLATTVIMDDDKNVTAYFAEITYFLTMAANPKSITADGTSNSTITVTVNDQDDKPVPEGTEVEFTTDKGSLDSLTSNTINGVATANLTSSTIVGTATVTATVGDDSAATTVFFTRAGVTVGDFKEEKTDPIDYTVDGKAEADTEVEKSGVGTPTITIARYSGNPEGATPGGFQAVGDYIDVHADNVTAVNEIVVKHYYTTADIAGINEASLTIRWWNGTAWVQCSDSEVTYPSGAPDYRGYVWAKITANTTPNLTDLTGTAFTSMATPSPRPSGGGGHGGVGAARRTKVLTLDFMGTIYDGEIDVRQGLLVKPLEVTSPDGLFTFKIGLDSKVLTTEGKVPDRIEIRIVSQPPSPPADSKIVSDVYEIIPSGITFQPAATLVLGFDPAGLPEHTSSLTMVYYTPEEGWVELESERGVAAELGTMTARIAHLTLFAILAKLQAAFEVSDLAITPTEVAEGESVTITIKVTNSGGATDKYALKLKIDDIVKAVREITLDPGVSQIISFTVEGVKTGEYKVEVEGLSGGFTVVTPSPPPPPTPTPTLPPPTPPVTPTPSNLPIISGIVVAIVAVITGLVYFFLYKRRKYAIGTLTGSLTVAKERLVALPLPKLVSYPAVIGRFAAEVGTAIIGRARFLVSKRKSKT